MGKKVYKIQPLMFLLSDKLKAWNYMVIISYVLGKCPESLTSFEVKDSKLWIKNDGPLHNFSYNRKVHNC